MVWTGWLVGIDVAYYSLMRAIRTTLILLSAALAALAWVLWLRPLAGTPAVQVWVEEIPRPLEESGIPAVPLPPEEPPLAAAAPEAVEGRMPVQTLKERDDAMLFEASALQGTPFDKAVVMPFD